MNKKYEAVHYYTEEEKKQILDEYDVKAEIHLLYQRLCNLHGLNPNIYFPFPIIHLIIYLVSVKRCYAIRNMKKHTAGYIRPLAVCTGDDIYIDNEQCEMLHIDPESLKQHLRLKQQMRSK